MLRVLLWVVLAWLAIAYAVYVYMQLSTPGASTLRILVRQTRQERKIYLRKTWSELRFLLIWPAILAFMVTVKLLWLGIDRLKAS